jgi:hypothetical protein
VRSACLEAVDRHDFGASGLRRADVEAQACGRAFGCMFAFVRASDWWRWQGAERAQRRQQQLPVRTPRPAPRTPPPAHRAERRLSRCCGSCRKPQSSCCRCVAFNPKTPRPRKLLPWDDNCRQQNGTARRPGAWPDRLHLCCSCSVWRCLGLQPAPLPTLHPRPRATWPRPGGRARRRWSPAARRCRRACWITATRSRFDRAHGRVPAARMRSRHARARRARVPHAARCRASACMHTRTRAAPRAPPHTARRSTARGASARGRCGPMRSSRSTWCQTTCRRRWVGLTGGRLTGGRLTDWRAGRGPLARPGRARWRRAAGPAA